MGDINLLKEKSKEFANNSLPLIADIYSEHKDNPSIRFIYYYTIYFYCNVEIALSLDSKERFISKITDVIDALNLIGYPLTLILVKDFINKELRNSICEYLCYVRDFTIDIAKDPNDEFSEFEE